MTEPFAEANEGDLAEQAIPAGDTGDEPGPFTGHPVAGVEADIADVIEQWQAVPTADDDYDRA